MSDEDQITEPTPTPPLQSQVTGDQPALVGEAGLDAVSPIDQTRMEIDMIVATLRRAFVTDVSVGSHFERLAAQIRKGRQA